MLFFPKKTLLKSGLFFYTFSTPSTTFDYNSYETQQSFTRIFSALYKQTPLEFRKRQMFYPLQLPFEFSENSINIKNTDHVPFFAAELAVEADIPLWMELVHLVIDGFPVLYESDYIEKLKIYISIQHALIVKDGETAAGILLFSPESGSIDFLGVHPFYRKYGIGRLLLDTVIRRFMPGKEFLSITTYREGDKADTGHRYAVKALGFTPSELLVEFGYPTQKFLLHHKK